jgi:hypothetical protein
VPTATAFIDRTSAGPGERLQLSVDSPIAYDVEWYRLGWYDGTGGRLMRVDRALPAYRAERQQPDAGTGLYEAPWPPGLELDVPFDWPSGMYVAVLRPLSGIAGYAPFVVRPSTAAAPILFVSAAATWQAYNAWGGKSLYPRSSSGPITDGATTAAVEVSFDRPYLDDLGSGFLQRWELQFVRWQERAGHDVEYMTDIDLDLHPELLDGRRLVVFAGHHEYWSRSMRDALEGVIAAGTNVCFLSANEMYWQVRLGPSLRGPARRMTCYRIPDLDPLMATAPELTTCQWREPPVSEPEARVIGEMYGHVVARPADWVVTNADHWVYAGTGLRTGDHLRNLVGQEFDMLYPAYERPGTVVLARSPVTAIVGRGGTTVPATHNATMYVAPSGATVFAAGTFQWSWALDGFGVRSYLGVPTPVDLRVAIMTENLFRVLG